MLLADPVTRLATDPHRVHGLRAGCQGLVPLTAKLQPWMNAWCESPLPAKWLAEFGSPLNVLNTEPFFRNVGALQAVAESRGLDFELYFARKANKCQRFITAAKQLGCGIDTASSQELQQVLDQDCPRHQTICTAAIKEPALLRQCAANQVTVVVDNDDERCLLEQIANETQQTLSIALRLSGFEHEGTKLPSRFGFDIDSLPALLATITPGRQSRQAGGGRLRIDGLHFHLDGGSIEQRVSAIAQSLRAIETLRQQGHQPRFLDIGGGIAVSYLESAAQWQTFWHEQHRALLGQRTPITYRNDGLGQIAVNGQVHGHPDSYPYYQSPVQAAWLGKLLDTIHNGETVADAIRRSGLQLRCEPGRSLLDGCGMTVARVAFRKPTAHGDWLIGLAMNRTQCRAGSDDFLVDPLLIPNSSTNRTPPIAGYLVGAYCMEAELLSLRKLRFANGIGLGDLMVFPNTAGYRMHFQESRSHQFPLAKNVFVQDDAESPPWLEPCDR